METDCNPMELSSPSGFEEGNELNGFEGTDMKDMRLEAEAVVNDVLFAVHNMFVSKSLRCADDVAYINVETKERSKYCLELTEAGLRSDSIKFIEQLPCVTNWKSNHGYNILSTPQEVRILAGTKGANQTTVVHCRKCCKEHGSREVVGYAFDQVDDHLQTPYHETVYSLLDTLSPAYREAFGNALLQRLEALKRDGQS